jgi:hypothetical protein
VTGVTRRGATRPKRRSMERALRNHNVWLALAYVGLILLLSRTYA